MSRVSTRVKPSTLANMDNELIEDRPNQLWARPSQCPPCVHLMSLVMNSPTIFLHFSASMYYCNANWRDKQKGRPWNEANELLHVAIQFWRPTVKGWYHCYLPIVWIKTGYGEDGYAYFLATFCWSRDEKQKIAEQVILHLIVKVHKSGCRQTGETVAVRGFALVIFGTTPIPSTMIHGSPPSP